MAANADSDVLRPVRIFTLAVAAGLVLLVPGALTVAGRFEWPELWVWILLIAGFAYGAGSSAYVVKMIKPRVANPDMRKILRGVAWLRLVLSAMPAFIALAVSLWLNTAIPYLVAVPAGVGLLLAFYPRESLVAAIRSRLEELEVRR
ncbi:MAG TPA: hypothetical protein VFC19_20225 [Candidatus Limnocylindrales bacterium]|nr:hypothetical protein [Candidatus Limnocylindrales bacterium]